MATLCDLAQEDLDGFLALDLAGVDVRHDEDLQAGGSFRASSRVATGGSAASTR